MMQEQHVVDKIKKSYPFVNLVFGTHNILNMRNFFMRCSSLSSRS
ncbi:hypothetical protein RUMOBE_03808 [Blautia obeum ATCC 29174]|uniref:Uncharacterized protein n=1 Tax=Blautia obeum ATCC 29174 TaxID=411459 RepID=A5ZXQ3_9FIRM|nr:hypothetical protein RUMOBE_03808 [Blautia obeum ATCC 29174]